MYLAQYYVMDNTVGSRRISYRKALDPVETHPALSAHLK